MRYSTLFIAFLFSQIALTAQVDTTFFNSYFVLVDVNFMKVEDAKGERNGQ